MSRSRAQDQLHTTPTCRNIMQKHCLGAMLKKRQCSNTLGSHSCLKAARKKHIFPFAGPGMEDLGCLDSCVQWKLNINISASSRRSNYIPLPKKETGITRGCKSIWSLLVDSGTEAKKQRPHRHQQSNQNYSPRCFCESGSIKTNFSLTIWVTAAIAVI